MIKNDQNHEIIMKIMINLIILVILVISDQFLINFCSISDQFLQISAGFFRFLQKYSYFAQAIINGQPLRRAAQAPRSLPAPRETSKIIDIPCVSEGCGLLRQRPADATPSCPAEAGRHGPKCAEITQNLQHSAKFFRNMQKLIRN